MSAALVVLALLGIAQLQPVVSTGIFYLKLDRYENLQGLLKVHSRCDNDGSCDPAFSIDVKGSWGSRKTSTDCIRNTNELIFGDKIGTNVTNPLRFAESAISQSVTLDIRIKDCLMGSPVDDIGEFYADLTDMPSPFLFTERVDMTDTERARTIDLGGIRTTPLSIKMRATVWRQCGQFYYGHDCSKFCRPIIGHVCDTSGLLICVGPGCNRQKQPQPPPLPPPSSRPSAASVAESSDGKAGRASADGQQGQTGHGSGALVATLSALLAVATVAAVGTLVAIRRCTRPKNRVRVRTPNQALIPPTHSMAVGVRSYSPAQSCEPAPQQDFSNAYYSLSQQLRRPDAGHCPIAEANADADAREGSGVYEMPDEPTGRELPPPLPARNNLPAPQSPSPRPPHPVSPPPPAAPGTQRTQLSRSFSKAAHNK